MNEPGRELAARPAVRPTIWDKAGSRHAVVHNNPGNANRVEPIAYFGALKVDRQDVISTSRKDDHSGARIFALGFLDRERWNRFVPKADQRLAGNQVAFGSRGVDLRCRARPPLPAHRAARDLNSDVRGQAATPASERRA